METLSLGQWGSLEGTTTPGRAVLPVSRLPGPLSPMHALAETKILLKAKSLQRGLGPNGAGRPQAWAPHTANSCRHPVKPSYVPVTLHFSSSESGQL